MNSIWIFVCFLPHLLCRADSIKVSHLHGRKYLEEDRILSDETIPPSVSVAPSDSASAKPSIISSTDDKVSQPPAISPSSLPIVACIDSEVYRSPHNPELACMHFRGTDCSRWAIFGYSVDQIQELIDSCPISCDIPCNSVNDFDLTITIRMMETPGAQPLDTNASNVIESSAQKLIQESLRNVIPGSVEILSQEHVNGGARNLRSRRMLEMEASLLLTLRFKGIAINMDFRSISEGIEAVLDSPQYESALRLSGNEDLVDARVSTNLVEGSIPKVAPEESDGSGPSSGGVAGAILTAIVILAAILCIAFRRQTPEDPGPFLISPVSGVSNTPKSPKVLTLSSPIGRMICPLSPIFRSPQSSVRSNGTSDQAVNSFMSRIVVMASRSTLMDEERTNQSPDTADSSSGTADLEPHPYMGVFPPMIVIDNIDQESGDERPNKKTANIVPGMKLHADSSLAAAINDQSNPFNASMINDFISKQVIDISSHYRQRETQPDIPASPLYRGGSFQVFSSEVEESDGANGSEYNESYDGDVNESTGGRSYNDDEEMEIHFFTDDGESPTNTTTNCSHTDSLVPSQPRNNTNQAQARRRNSRSRPPLAPGEISQRPASRASSPATSIFGRDRSISPPQHIGDASFASSAQTMSSIGSSPHQNQTGDSSIDDLAPTVLNYESSDENQIAQIKQLGLLGGFMAKISPKQSSEGTESKSEGESPASSRRKLSRQNSYGVIRDGRHKRALSRSSDPGKSSLSGARHKRNRSWASASSGGGSSLGAEGELIVFDAPPKGKLGLTIERRPFKGAVVTQVKDYSPLLGQVLPGDRIMSVNGTKTETMGISDIQKLLATASGSMLGIGPVKLTVLRSEEVAAQTETNSVNRSGSQHSFDSKARTQEMMQETSYDFDKLHSSPPSIIQQSLKSNLKTTDEDCPKK